MTLLPLAASQSEGLHEKPGKGEAQNSLGASGTKLGAGPDADWIDRFMENILARNYTKAREVLRMAVAQGIGKSVAEQYGKVLEDFLQQCDEVEKPKEDPCKFGVCAVREMDNHTGRGLIVPGYVNWGDELWKQRPVAYIQSPPSRKSVRVCNACLVPVGTLATQLEYLGQSVPEGAADIEITKGSSSILQCKGGCGEVFCNEACHAWAHAHSSHAILCCGYLSESAAAALQELDQLAFDSETEHLLLLAHHVAVAVLKLKAGSDLPDVMQYCVRQFCSAPWDSLADENDTNGDTPETRRALLERAIPLIRAIFADDERAAPFLEDEVLCSMLGTYELVNMCISIYHPLNFQGQKIAELLGDDGLGALYATQKGIDEESDSEDDDDSDGENDSNDGKPPDSSSDAPQPSKQIEVEAKEAVTERSLFAHVIGTSLVEALSYMNHSCLPNAKIDFMTSATPENHNGPGLWVYSAARRPLLPGDEVQMCYVPSVIGKPVEVRQKRMKKFGFECRCRCCKTDVMLKEEGDVIVSRK